MIAIRAVYRDGKFQPLEAVELREGQEVQVQIVEQPDRLVDAIADLLVTFDDDEIDLGDFDEEAVQRELDAALKGKRPLSEIIIEERYKNL